MTAKISKPGVYSIPIELYHSDCCAGPSTSSSELRTLFLKSPKHSFDKSPLNPDRDDETDAEKKSFILGRAAHHLLLGEDNFSTSFIMRPEKLNGTAWQGNRTECKAWLHAQRQAGRTVLTPDQIEQIRGMARELGKDPLVRAGILNGKIEQSLIWKDKKTGIWLKARPDSIPNDSGDCGDLKGTSAIGFDVDKSVSKFRYDVQAALTKWAFKEVLVREMTSFSLVFCGFDRPHCVDVLTLSPADIELAERDLRVSIDTFARCLETGDWFGPAGTQSDARWAHISEWAKKEAEFRRDFLRRELAASEKRTQPTEAECLSAG